MLTPLLQCAADSIIYFECFVVAPDWDALAEQYSSSSSVLIGSVDCTAVKAKELCEDYGIQGFPTLKYFKVSYHNGCLTTR